LVRRLLGPSISRRSSQGASGSRFGSRLRSRIERNRAPVVESSRSYRLELLSSLPRSFLNGPRSGEECTASHRLPSLDQIGQIFFAEKANSVVVTLLALILRDVSRMRTYEARGTRDAREIASNDGSLARRDERATSRSSFALSNRARVHSSAYVVRATYATYATFRDIHSVDPPRDPRDICPQTRSNFVLLILREEEEKRKEEEEGRKVTGTFGRFGFQRRSNVEPPSRTRIASRYIVSNRCF